ncbi:GNAT family N-acetyltransferase [Oceanicola sp. 502str15]|uniref:GNAT family N-acetyltransferase n=1 Tax=Oceanicola sp. 502str15 TaxID=2696061 RepID=UPI002095EFD6|nr:GNAT family N-acetyltransferase [Oceanicola sp. 502str15]MCO6383493.1 GNAT family N-acetyltransferase [Oceanicola sp. 502str15]
MIRPYTPGVDDDAIVHIFTAASRLAHGFLGETFILAAAEDVRKLYLPHAETHVWDEGSGPQGFIALIPGTPTEVGGFFMDPAHRGHGHGRALMDDALRRHGRLELDVFARNAIGRRFYARYGFTPLQDRHDPRFDQRVIRLRSPG